MDSWPSVSVVIPCRDEVRRIGTALDSIAAVDYPRDRLEVLVVDGMSADGTRDVVQDRARRHGFIRLVDNPSGSTPAALNAGIAQARGEFLVRMDAHAVYPRDYLRRLIRASLESGADNVGGRLRLRPAGGGLQARAIALVLAHPFGAGAARFKRGASGPLWVDTVPFGCYRRGIFERIGLFDEELPRNQDEEFNARLSSSGGRILFLPDLAVEYFPRDSLKKLWRMYYEYGYFKPLVARKVGRIWTWRQMAPAALASALAASCAAAPWFAGAAWAGAALTGAYLAVMGACAGALAARHGAALFPALAAAFVVVHAAYGLGYLRGALEFWVLRRGFRLAGVATAPNR